MPIAIRQLHKHFVGEVSGIDLRKPRGRELRSFSVRKEVKDHGAGGRIAGALEAGDRVVLTDDAITRGAAFLEAALR